MSSKKPFLNERWQSVVQNCHLDLTQPVNYVSTADIEKYGKKETRLMTSIETEKRNPEIFKQHGVFVIPLSRKQVVIVRGKGFHQVEDIDSPLQVHKTSLAFPTSLKNSKGEAGFLEYAYYCELIGQFTQRPRLRRGFSTKRRGSFTFRVDANPQFKAEGVQIEVDASFEDEEKYYLAEAKYNVPSSFNIKQLYYPYKIFLPEMKPREVQNIFFAYNAKESTYNLWEYQFGDPDDFEQIELVKSARFRVEYTTKLQPLIDYSVNPVQMGAIQANDVFKLMDLPFVVVDGIDDSHKLAVHYAFDERQSSYYRQGMEALGFISTRGNKYTLTELGNKYVQASVEARTKLFLRRLVEYPPVSEVIHRILSGEVITNRELESIASRHDPTIHKSTIERRAECLRTWFKWIADKTGYCEVTLEGISRKQTLNNFILKRSSQND